VTVADRFPALPRERFVGSARGGLHWSFWGVLSLARASGRWAHPGLAKGVPLAAGRHRTHRPTDV